MPARTTDSRHRQRRRGRSADPPAADRGRRLGKRVGAGPPPAPEQKRGGSALARRELEAAERRHPDLRALADHRAERAVAQPFLHRGQHILPMSGPDLYQATRIEPGLRQSGGEEIMPRAHPQRRRAAPDRRPRRDSRDEQRSGGIVGQRRAGRSELVKRVDANPAIRQMRIE